METREKPIASCEANGVEAWEYPFFIRPAVDLEPAYLYLQVHLWEMEMTPDLESSIEGVVRVDGPADLERLGYSPGEDGIYRI